MIGEHYSVDNAKPKTGTQDPICTGTSVIGVVFKDGIAIAADTLVSYGKMSRYRKVSRLYRVGKYTIAGMGGDYADYQFLRSVIENKVKELECADPEANLSPLALHSWLTAVLYNARTKMNPLWNNYIVGGLVGEEKKPYLGVVNQLGVAYQDPFIVTGIGSYFVRHMLEVTYEEKVKGGRQLTKEEAMKLLEECLQILYHRDCNAHNRFEIAIVTAEGSEILPAREFEGNWDIAKMVRGYE